MSEPLPPGSNPPDLPPTENLDYLSLPPDHAVARKLHLVYVFNYISCGLDLVGALAILGFATFIAVIGRRVPLAAGDPAPTLIAIFYGVLGIASLAFAIAKFIAIRKLVSR